MPAYSDITVRVDQKDDAARRAITSFANHYIREARRVEDAWKRVGMNGTPRGTGSTGGRSGSAPKAEDPMERARAHRAAMDAMARQEAAFAQVRSKYTGNTKKQDAELTKSLIADIKKLQDEKTTALNAMMNETDKATKAELRIRQNAIAQELRMMKSVALERQAVVRGGAGAPVGILGTGRNLISQFSGAVPGIGMGGGPAAVIAGLGVGLKKVIDVGMDFQTTMLDLQAIVDPKNKLGINFKALGETAKQLGLDFNTGPSEAVGSFKLVLGALGGDVAKDQKALESMGRSVLTFAKASGEDANSAAAALTNTMGQFGLSTGSAAQQADNMSRVMNVLAAGAQAGNAEIPQINAAMLTLGANAKVAGLSLEETVAMIETLAKAGIKDSVAGTGGSALLRTIQSGTPEAVKALKTLGLTFNEINPEKVGLYKSLVTLRGAFEKIVDPVQRARLQQVIFGDEGKKAASIMMQEAETFKNFTKDVTGTTAAQDQATLKMTSMAEQMEKFKAQMEVTALTIFDAISPALQSMMTALGPLTDVLGVVIDGVLTLGKVAFDLSNILGDVVFEAIKILVGGGDDLKMTWKDIVKGAHDAIKVFGDFARGAIQGVVMPAAKGLASVLRWLWEEILQPMGHYISVGFTVVWNRLKTDWSNFTSVITTVSGGLKTAWEWFKKLVSAVGELIGRIPGLGSAFRLVLGPINAIIRAVDTALRAISQLPGIGGGGGGSSIRGVIGGMGASGTTRGGGGVSVGGVLAGTGTSGTTRTGGGVSVGGAILRSLGEGRGAGTGASVGDVVTGGGGGGGGGGRGGGGSRKTAEELIKEKYDKAIAVLDDEHKQMLNFLREQLLAEQITQKEYDDEAARLDVVRAQAMLDRAKQYGQAEVDVYETLLNAKLALKNREATAWEESVKRIMEASKKSMAAMEAEADRLNAMETQQRNAMQARGARHRETAEMLEDEKQMHLRQSVVYESSTQTMNRALEFGHQQMTAEWMRFTGRFLNQNTALFQGLDIIYSVGMDKLSGILTVGIDKLGAFLAEYGPLALEWIGKNLAIGASFIGKAIAEAVSWMWATSPWLAIGGGLAIGGALVGFWNDIKKSLGFVEHAEGGIFKKPVFTRDAGGGGHVAGEAGPEVIAPLGQLRKMIGDEFAARVGTGRFRPGEALSGSWGDSFSVAPTRQLLQDAIDTAMTISIQVPGVKSVHASGGDYIDWRTNDPVLSYGRGALRRGRGLPATGGFADTLASVVVDSLKGVKLVTAIDQDRMELSRKRQVTRDAIGRM